MTLFVLDRDGVINHDSDAYIKAPIEWTPIPGSLEAIARLSRAGYRVVVASNQSGVGRGLFDVDTLFDIHRKFLSLLQDEGGRIDGFFFCPHHPDDGCNCRKPKPGMLQDICSRFGVRGEELLMVGDSHKDLEVVAAVGGQGVLVRTGKGAQTAAELNGRTAPEIHDDLAAFVDTWLAANSNGEE